MLIIASLIIGILAIITFAYGKSQQKQVTAEIIIQAPLESVWETWSAFSNVNKYVPSVRDAHTISDITGNVGHARRCSISTDVFVEEEIIAWNPERSFEIELRNMQGMVFLDHMNVLSEVEVYKQDTKAHITMTYKMKGIVDWLPIRGVMRQQAIDHLLGLKYLIEKGRSVDESTIKLLREAYSNFYSSR